MQIFENCLKIVILGCGLFLQSLAVSKFLYKYGLLSILGELIKLICSTSQKFSKIPIKTLGDKESIIKLTYNIKLNRLFSLIN